VKTRSAMTAFAAALLLGGATLFGACAGPKSTALVHPEKLQTPPICSSCHDADRAAYDHQPGFVKSHGPVAVRDQRTCEMCHKLSSCADCHPGREEIKPSDKRPSRFDAATPHRGDYLTQHRVDGRLDPASCFPCHGRKNDGRCRVCHQ
jgi:hypothetical protein